MPDNEEARRQAVQNIDWSLHDAAHDLALNIQALTHMGSKKKSRSIVAATSALTDEISRRPRDTMTTDEERQALRRRLFQARDRIKKQCRNKHDILF